MKSTFVDETSFTFSEISSLSFGKSPTVELVNFFLLIKFTIISISFFSSLPKAPFEGSLRSMISMSVFINIFASDKSFILAKIFDILFNTILIFIYIVQQPLPCFSFITSCGLIYCNLKIFYFIIYFFIIYNSKS